MIRSVLNVPVTLIDRRIDRRGYQLEAIVIVLLGLLGGSGMGFVAYKALTTIDQGMERIRFVLIGEVLTPLVVLSLVWILYTVASHFIANLYSGRGPISRLFRTTAWALLPVAAWYIIQSIVIAALFFGVDVPADPPGFSGQEMANNILYGQELGYDGLSSPVYTATYLSGLLFVAWSGYLLSLAVEQCKSVSTENARKIAAVPSGLFALYIAWQGLGLVGLV